MEAVTPSVASGSTRGLARLPLLRDYWNLRAASATDGGSFVDVLKVAIPTVLATLLTVAEQVTKLLAFAPNAARVLQALLPAVCAVICSYVVCRVEKPRKINASAGFATQRDEERPVYAFSEPARVTAKVLLPLFALLAVISLNEVAPNVGPRHVLAGYLCRLENGNPVAAGDVDVLNVSAQSAVVAPDIVGDDGFFAIPLRTWAGRPRVLRLRTKGCQPEDIDVTRSHGNSACCPAGTPDPTRRGDYPIWTVPCRPSAP
jgi:hypothetical protein